MADWDAGASDTQQWNDNIKLKMQHLAAATPAGTSLVAIQRHVAVTLATWDTVWGEYLHPEWAQQRMRLHGAQEKLEEEAASVSQQQWGTRKQLVVFFGNAGIGTRGGWGAKAVLQACRKVVERPNSGKPTDRLPGKVVSVDEFRTSRVSAIMNSPQPCEEELDSSKPTRAEGWKSGAEPLVAATPGDLGKWVDRDCNAALNIQRAGESKWRPLELCRWPHRARLPAKGKEYPALGFKKLRDRAPKALAQQSAACEPMAPSQRDEELQHLMKTPVVKSKKGFGEGGLDASTWLSAKGNFQRVDGAPNAEDGSSSSSKRFCPEEEANWFSMAYFLYCDGLIKAGKAKHLEQHDLWDIAREDDASGVYARFNKHLQSTVVPGTAPKGVIWRALWRTHGKLFIWTGVVKLVHDCVMFTPPYILSTLLHHIALGGSRKGSFYLSLAMLLTAVVENLLINYYFHILYRMSLHMKSEMITNIYEKSLRVTSAVKSELGVGAIVNLQSNDASKIWNIPLYLHIVWNGPFQIFVVMALLVRIMGWAPAMAGLAVTVVMIPLSTLVGKSLGTARRAMVKQTDARVKLATEIITGGAGRGGAGRGGAGRGGAGRGGAGRGGAGRGGAGRGRAGWLPGIKAIKLYAWEKPYEERIHQLREQELVHIRYTQMLSMLNTAVFQSGPVLVRDGSTVDAKRSTARHWEVSLAAFGVHSAMGYSLTAAVAFPALALFNLLRFPIIIVMQGCESMFDVWTEARCMPFAYAACRFPSQIMNMINARVGLQRIQKFLEADEMVGRGTDDSSSGSDNPFALLAPERALSPTHQLLTSAINTAADKDQDVVPLLPKANGQAQPANGHANGHSPELNGHAGGMVSPDPRHMGHLVAGGEAVVEEDIAVEVQGGTFAWERSKQPVISGLDLAVLRGQLVMVVGQDPWVQNCTLRANVLLGRAYDDELYTSVLAACALGPDLEVLAAGDATEIGEKGVNLSGGQKHRVALARAAYSGADIYLLDDPLSAVDAHVGRHLFDMCLCGLLAGSTRILVTHQLQYVDAADVVVVMSDGKVADLGTHKELKARGVDLNKFVKANSDAPTLLAPVPIPPSPPQTIQPDPQPQQTQPQPQPQPSALELIDLSRDSMKPSAGSARGSEAGVDQGSSALQLHGPSSSTSVSAGVSRTSSFSVGRRSVTGSRGPGLLRGEELVRSAAARRAASVQELAALRAALRRTLELKERDGKIVKVEERAVGQVARAVYRAYLGAWASAWVLLPAAVVLLAFSERGLQVGQNYVLSWWSNDTQDSAALGRKPHTKRWLTLYVMLGLISIGLQLVRAVMTITGAITASRQLHKQLMSKVVRLPMSFYDSQPTGRLLNRLTKDTEAVDVQVSGSVNMALICLVNALLSILVVSLVSPVALVALGPMSLLYYRIQAVYIATSRELKRLDSLAFSPIFQHFSESLQGLMSIRAFDKQALFIGQNKHNLNTSNRAYWPIQVVNRWLSVRLELMGAAIVFVTAVCVTVIMPASSGLVGLAISSALNLTGIMNWMVRQMTELEVNMNSVERMTEYLKYEEEAAAEVLGKQPPAGWPHAGAIEVRDLTVRYRPDLDPVLRSLSFSVRGCEKVGVCGRTGCGKSTLMITLYRLVEPCGGAIIIDGVDVAAIGLKDLRSRLSLVPQDPVIFSGTLRSNLDPFGAASGDAAIWEAVRRASLTDFVRGLDGGLDAVIKEGGANLSVGQRQLLCMARALLRASRILVLDEATSNVDNATDNLIQATIRSAFADCTVLTIAHRLHTIIDSDRILLLDAGKLAEFESPAVLLQRPGGAFRKLVEETTKGGGLNADAVQHALSAATQAAGSAP
ncbi:hypothetical protein QJQ45_017605 [Haematococcus lacustris]|nr:hypothetical protein QJQ45_017605 [Haematococcus lacustris]